MKSEVKKAVIVFLGNISYDTRCFNLKKSMDELGIRTEFIGFEWREPGFRSVKTGQVRVYGLTKKYSSIYYYLRFFFLLCKNLLFRRYDYYFAEDVYTLPAASVFSRLKRGKLFYDSRELFGFLAGLKGKKLKQWFWASIEKLFIKSADGIMVTGEMDGEFIVKQYELPESKIILLRNLPLFREGIVPAEIRKKYSIPVSAILAIYQGVIVKGRGLDIIFRLIEDRHDIYLLIAGSGEQLQEYVQKAADSGAAGRIIFTGNIPQENLLEVTASADLGFALIENLSVSYYYALPNKMFEYIMSGVPPLVSSLPQMKKIIDEHECGFVLDIERSFDEVKNDFDNMIPAKKVLTEMKDRCTAASKKLNWENDFENLKRELGI